MEEDDEDDLTGDMEDPTPENSISEVKITPVNAGKADLQVHTLTVIVGIRIQAFEYQTLDYRKF